MAKDYTNQHIVPKRYLDRFGTKDGKRTIIGARIVDKGNVRFFTDSTVNVGYIKNYYDDGQERSKVLGALFRKRD